MWATTALACAAKVGQLVVGGVCEEIEKLEFDPIIMGPDNPSRLPLLQILRILREFLGKTYCRFCSEVVELGSLWLNVPQRWLSLCRGKYLEARVTQGQGPQ